MKLLEDKVIVVTGSNDNEHALKAVALGAYDYYQKPIDPDVLKVIIDRAFHLYRLEQENLRLSAGRGPEALAGVIGLSGPYDFEITGRYRKVFGPPAQWPRAQAVNFVDGNEPPFLLIHGTSDNVVPFNQSELLHEALKKGGVQSWGGIEYVAVDDAGLHIRHNGKPLLLAVDNIIVCAGQEPDNELYAALQSLGASAHLVGGARLAAELDAMRAIREGTEAAARI